MRIFCWLNVSASKNLLCDSGLIQTVQMIDGILKKRKDFHFYLFVPSFISIEQIRKFKDHYSILDSKNVTIKYAPMSKIRRISPYHFEFHKMEKVIDYWNVDYDIVWNCLPEYLENLSQTLCRNKQLGWGHFNIPYLNRLHWIMSNDHVSIPDERIELKQTVGFLMADYNLTLCDYTIEMAKAMKNRWFPQKEIKFKTVYNGIEFNRIKKLEPKIKKKHNKYRLLFPNRLQSFKNPIFMLEALKKLREERDDFELILTDPTADFSTNNVLKNRKLIGFVKDNSDWITIKKVTGDDYYKLIYDCDVVINTSDYETWCLVITEALACGKNVVVPSGLTFEEMITPDYPFIYERRHKRSFLEKLQLAMEKVGTMKEQNRKYVEKYDWNNVIDDYIAIFDELKKKYIFGENYKTNDRHRLLEEIKKRGKMTKREIKDFIAPGQEKNWTRYRWYLLQNGVKDIWTSGMPVYYFGEKPKIEKQMDLF